MKLFCIFVSDDLSFISVLFVLTNSLSMLFFISLTGIVERWRHGLNIQREQCLFQTQGVQTWFADLSPDLLIECKTKSSIEPEGQPRIIVMLLFSIKSESFLFSFFSCFVILFSWIIFSWCFMIFVNFCSFYNIFFLAFFSYFLGDVRSSNFIDFFILLDIKQYLFFDYFFLSISKTIVFKAVSLYIDLFIRM